MEPWTKLPWRPFDKTSERAEPGFYTVAMPDDHLVVELSATHVAGIHRYTASKAGTYTFTWDTTSSIEAEADEFEDAYTTFVTDQQLEGHITYGGSYTGRTRPFTMYFVAE